MKNLAVQDFVVYCQPLVSEGGATTVQGYVLHTDTAKLSAFCAGYRQRCNLVPQENALYVIDPTFSLEADNMMVLRGGGTVLVLNNDLPPQRRLH